MHAPLVEQHHWYSSVLRGHYGYFGMPHNWRSLMGSGRKSGASDSTASSGEARRTGARAGTGSRLSLHACRCRPLGSLTLGHRGWRDAGNFREEPGAGKPPARICEGGAEWPSYSTTTRRCGVSQFRAAVVAGSPTGFWRMSGHPAVQAALRNHYFDSLGLPRLYVPAPA
jgi:hypothetical protein